MIKVHRPCNDIRIFRMQSPTLQDTCVLSVMTYEAESRTQTVRSETHKGNRNFWEHYLGFTLIQRQGSSDNGGKCNDDSIVRCMRKRRRAETTTCLRGSSIAQQGCKE